MMLIWKRVCVIVAAVLEDKLYTSVEKPVPGH